MAGFLASFLSLACGCYYGHLASGQMRLMLARESTRDIREDPETPARLREQLALVEGARRFATQLGLEVGQRYTSYVDWPGDRVVTTVVAARPGEVEAAGFHFPIVGRLPYKGFFDRERAEAEAEQLRRDGLDVCIVAVDAYSTLGWLDDPITAPMLRRDDTRLVETVVHELVHATVFVENQPSFNEGVARFIGQEAAVRFFSGEPKRADEVRRRVQDDRTIAASLLDFRDRVAALYALEPASEARREERAALEAAFRIELAASSLHTRDAEAIAQRARLGDACLALGGTYAADAARHGQLLESLAGDLTAFVERLRRAADEVDPRSSFLGTHAAAD